MLVASLRTMGRFHATRLVVTIDGGEASTDTPLLFVGNNDYHLAMPLDYVIIPAALRVMAPR